MKRLLFLAIALGVLALGPTAASAAAPIITVVNHTGHWIYIDTYEPFVLKHIGFVEANEEVTLQMEAIGALSHYGIHVYVKKSKSEAQDATIASCSYGYVLDAHPINRVVVSLDGDRCRIKEL